LLLRDNTALREQIHGWEAAAAAGDGAGSGAPAAAEVVAREGEVTRERLEEVMRRRLGYHRFRPLQERVVRACLAGQDNLVVMATVRCPAAERLLHHQTRGAVALGRWRFRHRLHGLGLGVCGGAVVVGVQTKCAARRAQARAPATSCRGCWPLRAAARWWCRRSSHS
jgi:hypothetical protein